jgi:hypothetical protein
MEQRWNDVTGANRVPVPLWPQIPHELTWAEDGDCVSPKRWFLLTSLHGVTALKKTSSASPLWEPQIWNRKVVLQRWFGREEKTPSPRTNSNPSHFTEGSSGSSSSSSPVSKVGGYGVAVRDSISGRCGDVFPSPTLLSGSWTHSALCLVCLAAIIRGCKATGTLSLWFTLAPPYVFMTSTLFFGSLVVF